MASRQPISHFRLAMKKIYIIIGAVVVISTILFSPPARFFPHQLVKIKEGSSVSEIAQELKVGGLIRSATVFKGLIDFRSAEDIVIAGNYYFPQRLNVWSVASRLVAGDFGLKPVRVTISSIRLLDFGPGGYIFGTSVLSINSI